MLTSKIHRIKDGKFSTFAEGEQSEYTDEAAESKETTCGSQPWGKPEADFRRRCPAISIA